MFTVQQFNEFVHTLKVNCFLINTMIKMVL